MNNRVIVVIVVAVLVLAGVGVYVATGHDSGDDKSNTAGTEITDALGRKVIVPENLDGGIVTIGSTGPLRFLSLFDVYDNIIEVDKGDVTDNKNGRAYSYAYRYDAITSYHADNALDSETVEKIVSKNSSLIVTTVGVWNNFSENFGTLASQCTVLVLNNQDMKAMFKDDGSLADYFADNVNMLGTMLGKEKRAAEVISGIESIMGDLKSLSTSSKEGVYVAGVTISGSNTLNTTFPVYLPLDLINATNAYNGDSTANKVVLNVESLATMDINLVVIDPSSSDKLAEADSQLVMQYLYGINNDSNAGNDVKLYVTVPIVWDSINYDCALASAYYLDYLLYDSLTYDQMVEKINGIFKVFYGDDGKDVLSDMSKFFVGKSSANNVELPILSEVKIVYEGGTYLIKAAS